MRRKVIKPVVMLGDLRGEEGNAFSILGKVTEALREAEYDQSYIDGYVERATAGDYGHLLAVSTPIWSMKSKVFSVYYPDIDEVQRETKEGILAYWGGTICTGPSGWRRLGIRCIWGPLSGR